VNGKRHKLSVALIIAAAMTQVVFAESSRTSVRRGNGLYADGNFNEAINQYDQALVDMPQAPEPKLNKANSYYRLDDLAKAIDLYKEVAAEAKDMKLVTKAKYNLGNCFFQEGAKQRDSDLQKALESMKTSITHWRAALDIEPENKKAARNIEVARLTIKDILDQINKQQDPNQPQDPNQSRQQQNQQGQQDQNQQNARQDPNQSQDPNQAQKPKQSRDPNESQDPNESNQQEQQQQQQQQVQEQQTDAPDTTAQKILDKEQQQKKERQILQRQRYLKVERDW
jgi:Ca-activated chloride channel family protein